MPKAQYDTPWATFNANNPTGMVRDEFDRILDDWIEGLASTGGSRHHRWNARNALYAAYGSTFPTLQATLPENPHTYRFG